MSEERKRLPRYLRLYQRLRQEIIKGRYRYGERLPSKRMMALESSLSVITIEHCYELLLEEGYIEARERSGYYVCYREDFSFPVAEGLAKADSAALSEKAKEELHEGQDSTITISMSSKQKSGEAEGIPFTIIARTIRRVITEYGDRICQKSPGSGVPELRAAIASYLRRSRGINVLEEQIIIGSGAEYLYMLLVQLLGKDRIYGIENPSYEKIERIYKSMGAVCERLKLGRDGIISSELRKSRANVLHVTPFNSFPSGVTATASKRREYISWAASRSAVIVEDDFDSEFSMSSKAEDTLFSLEPERTVLYMNSFTKTVAPSFRMAYLLLPRELAGELSERISFYSCTVPVLEQYLLAELIQNGDFERNINRVRRRRRQLWQLSAGEEGRQK